jgi:hypothetical protein
LLAVHRQLDDELDLYRSVEGELGDTDGASGVRSSLAEDLAQEVRRAVYNLWLAVEPGGGGDVARDLYHPAHVLQRAGLSLDGGKGVERAEASSLLRFFDGDVFIDFSGVLELPFFERELAGGKRREPVLIAGT